MWPRQTKKHLHSKGEHQQNEKTTIMEKNRKIASITKNIKKREPLCNLGRNVNGHSHYEKQYGDFPKN